METSVDGCKAAHSARVTANLEGEEAVINTGAESMAPLDEEFPLL